MQISFTFRNMETEEWLKDYVGKKLARIERYIDKPVIASVVLAVEKFRNVAEINLSAKGINLQGREEAKEMTLAVDNVIDKVERQIKKYKQKVRNHKDAASRSETVESEEPDVAEYEEYDEDSRVAKTQKIILEPMSLDDAVMEMDESKNRFIVYRDFSSENVSILYRRDDGRYLLIETNS
ncbi:MAG: ribosome-associated translation inhibitor RaiA [Deltaproteobacteria bacterium]|nr:ribosome-associated translation inhibitor RaiA [Deltaproteobacteria bacterium]